MPSNFCRNMSKYDPPQIFFKDLKIYGKIKEVIKTMLIAFP